MYVARAASLHTMQYCTIRPLTYLFTPQIPTAGRADRRANIDPGQCEGEVGGWGRGREVPGPAEAEGVVAGRGVVCLLLLLPCCASVWFCP